MAFCNNCGSYLPDDATSCPICNTAVRSRIPEEAPAENITAQDAGFNADEEEYGTTVLTDEDYAAPVMPEEAQPAQEESDYQQYFTPEPQAEEAPQQEYYQQPQQEQYYQQPQQEQYYQQPQQEQFYQQPQQQYYQQPQQQQYYQQPQQQYYQQQQQYQQQFYGTATQAFTQSNSAKNLGVGALVASFFIPLLGLILGIVGISKCNSAAAYALQVGDMGAANQAKSGKGLSIAGIIISAVYMVLSLIIIIGAVASEYY